MNDTSKELRTPAGETASEGLHGKHCDAFVDGRCCDKPATVCQGRKYRCDEHDPYGAVPEPVPPADDDPLRIREALRINRELKSAAPIAPAAQDDDEISPDEQIIHDAGKQLDAAQELIQELVNALKGLCDSLRLRQGPKLINVNHDELMELIPKGRAALARAERKEGDNNAA